MQKADVSQRSVTASPRIPDTAMSSNCAGKVRRSRRSLLFHFEEHEAVLPLLEPRHFSATIDWERGEDGDLRGTRGRAHPCSI